MYSLDLRLKNDLRGLRLVHEFGWLRAPELGLLMWPQNSSSAEAANRVIRSWKTRKFIIVRSLPDQAGNAIVLDIEGVRLLADHDYTAKSGKNIGNTLGTKWIPPHSWRHDLLATGVLAQLAKQGYSIIPEQSLRRLPSDCDKRPNGLIFNESQNIWLEVEHSIKSGKNSKEMTSALIAAASGMASPVADIHCNLAMVAYTEMRDTRGYAINHKSRVIAAIKKNARKSVNVLFAYCKMQGVSVTEVQITNELITPLAYEI